MTTTVGYAPQEVEAIAAWLKDKMSASQIAALLSDQRRCPVSRNAIIGVVHRNADLHAIGFARGRGKVPGSKRDKTRRFDPGARAARREFKGRLHLPGPAFIDATAEAPAIDRDLLMLRTPTPPPRPRPETSPAAYDAASRHVQLTELGRDQCRFPVNDAEPGGLHLFCGETVAGETYCAHHAARCFGGFSMRAA